MKKFSNRQDFSRRTKAFTLIEMLVAISISALFIGGFVLIIGAIYTETDIRKPATKLEVLAQRVRTIATVHQRTYQIYFTQKGFYGLECFSGSRLRARTTTSAPHRS